MTLYVPLMGLLGFCHTALMHWIPSLSVQAIGAWKQTELLDAPLLVTITPALPAAAAS